MITTDIKSLGRNIGNPNDKDTYKRYLAEISKYHPLSREEEIELFNRIKENDDKAIEKICKHNLRFVVSVAKCYSPMLKRTSITLEDLISEGNLGMCIAAKRFDVNTGNKFISYAVWWIKQAILNCIGKNVKNIRIPNNIVLSIRKMKLREEKLEQELGRAVSMVELFDSLLESPIDKLNSINKLEEWYAANLSELSLDTPILLDSDNEATYLDIIKSNELVPHDFLEVKEKKEQTHQLVAKMPIHIQEYMKDYFGLNDRIPLKPKEMSEKYEIPWPTIKDRIDRNLRKTRYRNKGSRNYFLDRNKD